MWEIRVKVMFQLKNYKKTGNGLSWSRVLPLAGQMLKLDPYKRRSAWPLSEDDIQFCEVFNMLQWL